MAPSPLCHKVLYPMTSVEDLTAWLYCCCRNKTITFRGVPCLRYNSGPTWARSVYRRKERTVAGDRLTLLCKFLGRVWCSPLILCSVIRSELVNILWLIKRACSACSVPESPSQLGSRAALFSALRLFRPQPFFGTWWYCSLMENRREDYGLVQKNLQTTYLYCLNL